MAENNNCTHAQTLKSVTSNLIYSPESSHCAPNANASPTNLCPITPFEERSGGYATVRKGSHTEARLTQTKLHRTNDQNDFEDVFQGNHK